MGATFLRVAPMMLMKALPLPSCSRLHYCSIGRSMVGKHPNVYHDASDIMKTESNDVTGLLFLLFVTEEVNIVEFSKPQS